MGARVIEKHYTLNRKWTGSGHFFSIQPEDLKEMILNIELTKTVLGNGEMGVTPSEERAIFGARKSIVASVDIKKGTRLTEEMLTFKRPAIGLSPENIIKLVGKIVKFDIPNDTIIKEEMVK